MRDTGPRILWRSPDDKERDTHPSRDAQPGGAGQSDDGQPDDGQSDDGSEPDARFTLANERTFLAWSRTSLALVVAGLAVAQLLPPFPRVSWGRSAIATPLILLGGAVSVISYFEWTSTQRAMRGGKPVGRTLLPKILSLTIGLIALLAAALELYSKATRR